jgi:hypothetical protein
MTEHHLPFPHLPINPLLNVLIMVMLFPEAYYCHWWKLQKEWCRLRR